jgi:PAS domain S-box-containing protein
MVVEDDAIQGTSLAESLADLGYEISGTALSAHKAFELIEHSPPDLVLMDIKLRGATDGIDAATRIQNEWGIPVVFLTGFTAQDVFDRAKRMEPYGYVSKPTSIGELRNTIEMALCRHAADRRIRESETRFRDLVEHSQEGIVILNPENAAIEFVNPQVLEMSGFSEEEIKKRQFLHFIHPDDLATVEAYWERKQQGEHGPHVYECRMARKEGGFSFVKVKSLRSQWNGKPAVVAFISDLTVMYQRKEEHRHLFEHSPISQWEEDFSGVQSFIDGLKQTGIRNFREYFDRHPESVNECASLVKVLRVNQATCHLFGATSQEQFQKELTPILCEESLDIFKDGLIALAEGGAVFEAETVNRTLNGATVHVLMKWSVIPGYQGDYSRVLVSLVDITARARAEDGLRESEERYRLLAENALVGVYIHQDDFFMWVNDKLCGIVGYSADEMRQTRFWEIFAPELQNEIKRRGRARYGGNAEPNHYQSRIQSRNGEIRWVEVSAASVQYRGKTATLGTISDITDQKRAEQRIQASLTEKETLLREIHHRVKNNLAIVSSLLALQSFYSDGAVSEQAIHDLQRRIQSMALAHKRLYESENITELSALQYLGSLVNDLITASIGVGGDVRFEKEIADPALDLDTAVPLGLILTELLSNCLKHAFRGRSEGTIKVSFCSPEEGVYELVVADDGVGIPDELDFDNPNSMGLELVNTFVEQLHGNLELTRNEGTRIRIRFPAK